jgi:hypothetical protein
VCPGTARVRTGNGAANAYPIVRPGWFDDDRLMIALLQGDTRHAGSTADGVIARHQVPRVHVRSTWPGGWGANNAVRMAALSSGHKVEQVGGRTVSIATLRPGGPTLASVLARTPPPPGSATGGSR